MENENTAPIYVQVNSVADTDSESGASLNLGSGIGFFSGSRIPNPYFESLVEIFGVQSTVILCKLAKKIFFLFKNKIKFCDICDFKKVEHFFSLSSFVAVLDSGWMKNLDPGSGINIPDPQHCR